MTELSPARKAIVDEALTWVGTPFHHQGRAKGTGVDCLGVVIMSAQAAGIDIEDRRNYPRQPDQAEFLSSAVKYCDVIRFKELQPGDLIHFNYGRNHVHVGVYVGDNKMVHAYADRDAVEETLIDSGWIRRMAKCYRFKAIDG